MHQIKVINGSKTDFMDRFDGLAYKFPAEGAGTNLPLEAACHIFGVDFPMDAAICESEDFRAEIFRNLSRRWGWNIHEKNKLAVGAAVFKKFSFVPVELKTVELAVKNQDLPLPRGDVNDTTEDADEEEQAV